jgi:hypothetical protein
MDNEREQFISDEDEELKRIREKKLMNLRGNGEKERNERGTCSCN